MSNFYCQRCGGQEPSTAGACLRCGFGGITYYDAPTPQGPIVFHGPQFGPTQAEFAALTADLEEFKAKYEKVCRDHDARLTEVARLRETNTVLNRRCQSAESAIAEKAKTSGTSLGRILANAEAERLGEENKRLREALEGLVDAVEPAAECGDPYHCSLHGPMQEALTVARAALRPDR
jgi:hypothetical protein